MSKFYHNPETDGYIGHIQTDKVAILIEAPPKFCKRVPEDKLEKTAIDGSQHFLKGCLTEYTVLCWHDGKIHAHSGSRWSNAKNNLRRALNRPIRDDEIALISYERGGVY